ncbi:MAG: D-tyrosyl-tRNA(Tyr) deacylase [Calditrichaeota bacterium]|nr:MAG: D-tyrosyl-tRNA(Tyr) deacylase [Calditrichota bacterium]
MRALIQRVAHASVSVEGELISRIERGLVVLLGIKNGDDHSVAEFMAQKMVNLRIFEDQDGKLNLSALDVGAEILAVSQFTLYADTRRGRRPGFSTAAPPEISLPLYQQFVALVKQSGLKVKTGQFGAHMKVEIINDGPVTIMLDSEDH